MNIHITSIAMELQETVQDRLAGRVHNFRILARKQGLVLQGDALSFYAKQLAQHIVMEATSVPIVANEIAVGCPERDALEV
jgi:hypothetical protein